jgi:hypothetical protein
MTGTLQPNAGSAKREICQKRMTGTRCHPLPAAEVLHFVSKRRVYARPRGYTRGPDMVVRGRVMLRFRLWAASGRCRGLDYTAS